MFLDMQWFRVVMLEHGGCLKVLGCVLEVGLFVWVFVVCVSGVLTITLASRWVISQGYEVAADLGFFSCFGMAYDGSGALGFGLLMLRGLICDDFVWFELMVKCGYGKWCSFVVIRLYVCGGFWFWVFCGR